MRTRPNEEPPRCPLCDYRLLRIFSSYFCSNCRELIQPCAEGEH